MKRKIKLGTETYKSNALKAVKTRKDNILRGLHYKRRRRLVALLDELKQATRALNEVDKETILAQEIRRTTMKSFCRHGDRNCLTPAIILHYIRKDGIPLDSQAMDLTEQYGIEITEQDFYEFILAHECGRTTFYKYQEIATIKGAIKDLTLFNPTPKFIKYLQSHLMNQATQKKGACGKTDDIPF